MRTLPARLSSLPARRAALAVWLVAIVVGSMVRPRAIASVMPHFHHADWLLHAGGYAVLCLLAVWAWPGQGRLRVAAGVVLFGVLIELLQPLTGRTTSGWDALANTAGVACGLLAQWLMRRRRRAR